jgi:hypothetical protein
MQLSLDVSALLSTDAAAGSGEKIKKAGEHKKSHQIAAHVITFSRSLFGWHDQIILVSDIAKPKSSPWCGWAPRVGS